MGDEKQMVREISARFEKISALSVQLSALRT
jgi:hypothetical protein